MNTSRLPRFVALSLALTTAPALAQDEAVAPATTTTTTSEVVAPPLPSPRVGSAPDAVVEHEETCGEAASSIARGSVVQVVSGEERGSGFLFHDSSHVITSFGIVREGHGVTVTDADGNTRSARIVNSAQGDDLAMLELGAPLPGAPLALADENGLIAGASIVVLSYTGGVRVHGGPSTAGLSGLHTSTGTLSAIGDRAVQLDAPLATASSGGPVLDCRGSVLAMLSVGLAAWGVPVHLGTSRSAIADLESRIDHPEGYGGRVRFFMGLGISMAYEDPGGPMGGYAELGLIALDAFTVAGRFHYLMREDSPVGSDVVALRNERFRGDAYVAFRQLVTLGGWGMHFEIGLGGSVTSRSGNVRRALIDESSGAPVLLLRDEPIAQSWSVRPMAVANLELGPLLIGYTLEVDIDRLHVVHLFDLGFRL